MLLCLTALALRAAEFSRWAFTPVREPSGDITAQGWATLFSDHITCSGVPADRPDAPGVALPRGLCQSTRGSGFEGVADLTLVRLYCPATRKLLICPVIDEGPAFQAQAGQGRNGSAMVDLNPAAAKALAVHDNAFLHIRILAVSDKIIPITRRGAYR